MTHTDLGLSLRRRRSDERPSSSDNTDSGEKPSSIPLLVSEEVETTPASPVVEIFENDELIFENVDFTDTAMVEAFRLRLAAREKETETKSDAKAGRRSSFFHFISVFSTTMWIHINHGDDGLRAFFITVKSFLLPHFSALLVEPQPPKCYTNAARRCRKLRISYPPFLEKVDRTKALSLLASIIERDLGLSSSYCFGKEEWGRALNLYYEEGIAALFASSMEPKDP